MGSTGIIEMDARCSDVAFKSCSSELYIDNKFVGYTPIQIFIPTGSHSYKLIKPGYFPPPPPPPPLMSGVADVQHGIKFSLDIDLINSITTGALSIYSTPEGAKIFIDDKDQKVVTPAVVSGLKEGEHTYKLSIPGYDDITRKFEMILGQSTSVNATLFQLKDYGTLYIYPTPVLYGRIIPYILEGAKIYIDNVDTGKIIPSPITGLSKGIHTFRISRPGVRDSEGMFVINGEDIILISVYPILLPKIGMAIIHVLPPVGDTKYAHVTIDGKDTGEYTNVRFALPEGTHTYRLQLEGYEDVEGKFDIIENRITRVTTYMIRMGVPPLGRLNISSEPPGADVNIDDVEMGQYTPSTIRNLSDGDYTYRLIKPGYLDTTGTFTISNGNTVDLHPTLIQSDSILDISCNVIASMIYIDEHTEGWTTPTEIIGIAPGTHTYRLIIPEIYGGGFDSATGTFSIEKGKITRIDAKIDIIKDGTGSLIINSIPNDAKVFIDDIDMKTTTPSNQTNVQPGIHKVKLTFPGYKDWIGTVNIMTGSIVSIFENLVPEKI